MFGRWADSLSKPRKKHSLENFKYLYQQLIRHPVIDESNQMLIVETLRSIAELLIWGDQHETRFFDFFFEKNIHSFFLRILSQKTNSTITVQLLQTLSILFENIQTETSIYYLLSNNYVNQIICHKFDFSDEEILAYYISFLKTLSLKLNKNTIHFFYNEHLNDFPLYTEAIKFFNHDESMIRVAVRTLTLNVFRVPDERMLRFVLDRTAVPYFSNLVWFMSDQSVSLNDHIMKSGGTLSPAALSKLKDMVAEHLDNLFYLNDILCLKVHAINEVLTAQVIKKLLIPLYVHSLVPLYALQVNDQESLHGESRLSPAVALFLIAHALLIFTHPPIVKVLAHVLVEPTPKVYMALMDEFAQDMSEVRIAIHADPAPPIVAASPGKGKNKSGQAPAASAAAPSVAAAPTVPASGPGSVQIEPLSALVVPGAPIIPAVVGIPPLSSDSPKDSARTSTTSIKTHSRTSSTTSSGKTRMGPPAGPDGRTSMSTADPFVFTPRSLHLADEMLLRLIAITGLPPGPVAVLGDATAIINRNVNVFRLAILDYLDTSTSDTLALPAVCLLNVIMLNTVVPPEILLEGALSPRRLVKSKALVNSLTSAPPPVAPAPAPAAVTTTSTAIASLQSATLNDSKPLPALASVEPGPVATTAPAVSADGLAASVPTATETADAVPAPAAPLAADAPAPSASSGLAVPPGPLPGQVLRHTSISGPVSTAGPRILPVPFFTPADGAASVGGAPSTADLVGSASVTSTTVRRPRSTSTTSTAVAADGPGHSSATAAAPTASEEASFNPALVERILGHLLPGFAGSRSVTLSVAIATLLELVRVPGEQPVLLDRHYDLFEKMETSAKAYVLRYLDNAPEVFLDMFEEMARTVQADVDVSRLVGDTSILLPPSQTPMSGIDLSRRLPCGEAEKVRKAVHDFWLVRRLRTSLLPQAEEDEMPLLEAPFPILPHDVLDLNNSDMIRCTVVDKEGYRFTRYLVVDAFRLLLVEPDVSRVGWGVVRQVSPLQHTLAEYDKSNPDAMDVTVAVTGASGLPRRPGAAAPTWSAKFLFDDHVVCMTAKQHLDKGRQALRAQKLARIRTILTATAANAPTELAAPASDPGAAGETAEPTADPADRQGGVRMMPTAWSPLPALPTDAAARSDI